MTISSLANSVGAQSLDRPLAFDADANRERQASTADCGDLVVKLFPYWTDGTAAAAQDPTPTRSVTPLFKGFEASSTEDVPGSLKHDAFNVLQRYDPRDPASMKSAFALLCTMRPGQYELDAQDNLMLTGTAEGYIGARPFNRESDWTDRIQDWSWDCMEYNVVHPGPNGEGLGPVRPEYRG